MQDTVNVQLCSALSATYITICFIFYTWLTLSFCFQLFHLLCFLYILLISSLHGPVPSLCVSAHITAYVSTAFLVLAHLLLLISPYMFSVGPCFPPCAYHSQIFWAAPTCASHTHMMHSFVCVYLVSGMYVNRVTEKGLVRQGLIPSSACYHLYISCPSQRLFFSKWHLYMMLYLERQVISPLLTGFFFWCQLHLLHYSDPVSHFNMFL